MKNMDQKAMDYLNMMKNQPLILIESSVTIRFKDGVNLIMQGDKIDYDSTYVLVYKNKKLVAAYDREKVDSFWIR